VVAALALTTTPVSYKAGTDTAHPHAFVQFLVEAATDAMDHHRPWSVGVHEVHGAHAADEATYVASASSGQSAFDQVTPVNERTSAWAISLLLAWFAIGGGSFLIANRSDRLHGLAIRPPSPPPRGPALAL
jgi:hypothetical protein